MCFFNITLTNYKYSHLRNLQYNMATQINYSLHYNNSCLHYYYYHWLILIIKRTTWINKPFTKL